MCIIISKDKFNKNIPTKEELKNCFSRNNDGAGFMYVNNGQVIIDKGYMQENDFLNRFDYLCKKYNNFKNKALVIHCRIGTSASNSKENTHPYILTNKEKLLHKTYIKSNLGIVHNGIINDYTPKNKNTTINDTQNFIINYLYPLQKNYNEFYKNKFIMNGIQKITNSKFAILDNRENIYYIGNFTENEKHIKFSNDTYKKIEYNYYNYYDSYYDNYWKKYNALNKTENKILNYPTKKVNELNYYDKEKTLVILENDFYVEIDKKNICDKVKNISSNTLVYDLYNCDLYELINNELILINTDVIIYDYDFNEL